MDLTMFDKANMPGDLAPISGLDPDRGEWSHAAFVPDPLPRIEPTLQPATYRQVADTRAALATLDSTARQLPNPGLLRRPTLTREAQSTSALEGTYAPLADVLDEDELTPSSTHLREILNYVLMADQAFAWLADDRPLTVGMLCDLQKTLVSRTPSELRWPGQIRGEQVVIGRRSEASESEFPVKAARFVPAPPGLDLESRVRDLVDWIDVPPTDFDPVISAAICHVQFESLHPFWDGNGRVGRLLIILQLMTSGTLSEPTLSVSPWFESRRSEYYERLFAVSTDADWDGWVRFFAAGLASSARSTHKGMLSLLRVQEQLHERVRSSRLRSDNAHALIDFAVGHPSFTAREVQEAVGISYQRANSIIAQLVDLGVLEPVRKSSTYQRRFRAPAVTEALLT